MPEITEITKILIKIYGFTNKIKVCLAMKDIDAAFAVTNELNDYLVSIDVGDVPKCDFSNCENEAQFEGWYRVLDFANQPTGRIQKMVVCKDCVKYLIGKLSPSEAKVINSSSTP